MALTTALGALLGFSSNTKDARTSTATSTTAPTYTAGQTNLQGGLLQTLQDRLTKGIDLKPLRSQGVDQINKTYAGVGDRLTSSLASRGFGSSGSVGSGLRDVELSRAGAIGNLDSQLYKYSLDEGDKTLDLAGRLAYASPGSSSEGSSVGAGSPFAGGLAGGLTAFLQQLNQAFSLQGAGA